MLERRRQRQDMRGLRRKVGLLMRIDVGCEDVEFPAVESGVVNCYDFLCNITVDPQKVEPDGLTHSLQARFLKAKDGNQV